MNKRTKKLLAMMAAPPRLRRVSGLPPLSYTAKKAGFLTDYRIYGQTSRNLFDINNLEDHYDISTETGLPTQGSAYSGSRCAITTPINVSAGDYYLTFNKNIAGEIGFIVSVFENNTLISRTAGYYSGSRIQISSGNNIYIGFYNQDIATVIYSSDISNIMLNSGSTPLPYEPYGESVGDRTGNLFDYETMSGISGKRLDSNGNEITDLQWAISGFIPCTGNAFTISKLGGGTPAICLYDENQNFITGKAYNTDSAVNKKSITITAEETAKFVRFSYCVTKSHDAAYDDLTAIMLNIGAEALPYEPYGYRVPVTVSNGTDTLTTPIYLPEQIKKVGDEAEYIDYGLQKQHRVRKNLLPNTATSQTINGVTFTVNSDGSVTCNGTASNTTELQLIPSVFSLPIGTYELNGAPTGGEWTNNFKLDLRVSLNTYYADTGNGIQFNILQDETITMCRIVIYSGYTCDNLTFYPMIRKADIEDDTYEPYIENTDLDVTLPALPTVTGTNVLSVGTEVQPSLVEVTGRIRPVPTGGGE